MLQIIFWDKALWSHGPMVKEKMRKLQEMGFGQLVKVEKTV